MKRKLAVLVIGLAALFAALPTYAQQNTMIATTLSAAVNDSTNTVRVASATGITVSGGGGVQTSIVVDSEYMVVSNVNGTTLTVIRGQGGSRAYSHSSGSVVLAGRPGWFAFVDPSGSCVAANVLASPTVVASTGQQWLCSTVLSHWVPGWGNPGTSGTPIEVTTAVASAVGTITPSGPLFHVTGNLAITGFVIPVGYNGGPFCIIPDGTFTTTTAGNIALASTAVVSKQLCYAYDKNAAKPFFPAY